jgi:hypothetical protein
MKVSICHPSYRRGVNRKVEVQVNLDIYETPPSPGKMAQVVECPLNKLEALVQIPIPVMHKYTNQLNRIENPGYKKKELFFFFFWWYWGLNSGLVLAMQVFYHLSHVSTPFLLYVFF